jgi:transcriptional regulator with XRE-family HTH domain
VIATASSFQILRYWDFDYPRATELGRPLTDAAYIEQFRETLNEAVRIRMRADVPVGCYLSGGLDSCSVLGMAATHTSTPIQAFTLTFDQKDYDEGKIAEAMAARAGVPQPTVARIESRAVVPRFDTLDKLLEVCGRVLVIARRPGSGVDRSPIQELLEIKGLGIVRIWQRFLPFTMSNGFRPPAAFVSLYLKLAWIWPLVGRQFLVIAQKP